MRELRIAFAGSSGAGKTTMVNYLKEKYKLPWINGSSGQIKHEQDNFQLKLMGLDQGHGHAAVIRSGHQNPIAAGCNQQAILRGRIAAMRSAGLNFVTDRSPIDSIVYMLMQCSMYEGEVWCGEFIKEAKQALAMLTHIIWVRPLDHVEDNGSRVPNIFFQQVVDGTFDMVISKLMWDGIPPKVCQLTNTSIVSRQLYLDSILTS
jgi:hypothetical protein